MKTQQLTLECITSYAAQLQQKQSQETTGAKSTRQCSLCKDFKLLSDFKISNTTPKKIHYKSFCKSCDSKISKDRREIRKNAPPQSEQCDLCGKVCKTYLDHCHNSLLFRGWLCNECNTGLGKFNEDTNLLKKAITYLNPNETTN